VYLELSSLIIKPVQIPHPEPFTDLSTWDDSNYFILRPIFKGRSYRVARSFPAPLLGWVQVQAEEGRKGGRGDRAGGRSCKRRQTEQRRQELEQKAERKRQLEGRKTAFSVSSSTCFFTSPHLQTRRPHLLV
jgi:hypothetical protein